MDEAIEVLRDFLTQLPDPHQERPGIIRAIEVLTDEIRQQHRTT